GPVAPEDLVAADGRCAPKAEPASAPAAPSPAAAQPATGASAPLQASGAATLPDRLEPSSASTGPVIARGVALGMSECDVVRRVGQPSNVSIAAGKQGERKVVISYLSGEWPGIY